MFEHNLFGKSIFRIDVYLFEAGIFQLDNYFQPYKTAKSQINIEMEYCPIIEFKMVLMQPVFCIFPVFRSLPFHLRTTKELL